MITNPQKLRSEKLPLQNSRSQIAELKRILILRCHLPTHSVIATSLCRRKQPPTPALVSVQRSLAWKIFAFDIRFIIERNPYLHQASRFVVEMAMGCV